MDKLIECDSQFLGSYGLQLLFYAVTVFYFMERSIAEPHISYPSLHVNAVFKIHFYSLLNKH